jgi:hypothetical protein
MLQAGRQMSHGSILGTAMIVFCSQHSRDRFWDPPSLLYSGLPEAVTLRLKRQGALKLTSYTHLVPSVRIVELYRNFPMHLLDVLLR